MAEFLSTLQSLFTFAFVVSSMLAMGLALTIGQIVAPLSNQRLVLLALVANFVLVPGVAFGLAQIIPMDDELKIGLILMGSAAGAMVLVMPLAAEFGKRTASGSGGSVADQAIGTRAGAAHGEN